jgi:hypothetical protein
VAGAALETGGEGGGELVEGSSYGPGVHEGTNTGTDGKDCGTVLTGTITGFGASFFSSAMSLSSSYYFL